MGGPPSSLASDAFASGLSTRGRVAAVAPLAVGAWAAAVVVAAWAIAAAVGAVADQRTQIEEFHFGLVVRLAVVVAAAGLVVVVMMVTMVVVVVVVVVVAAAAVAVAAALSSPAVPSCSSEATR